MLANTAEDVWLRLLDTLRVCSSTSRASMRCLSLWWSMRRCLSDTPSFGSQKSLAVTVSWLRSTLRRPNTALRWTATQNMLIDALTKDMEVDHLQSVLQKGRWCMKFNAAFVKQNAKPKAAKVKNEPSGPMVGQDPCQEDPVLSRLMNLSDNPGWHTQGDVAIHVTRDARSFRTPQPRFDPELYSIRSTYGRFDHEDGTSTWRELEKNASYAQLPGGSHRMIGRTANVLVTFFRMPSQSNKKDISPEDEQ